MSVSHLLPAPIGVRTTAGEPKEGTTFHHPSCVAIECESCHGAGTIHVTRTRWVGNSRDGYQRIWDGDVRCEGCNGEGRQYVSEFSPLASGADNSAAERITFNGHEANAPGFTQDQFDRAIVRAFIDDLEVTETDTPDRYIVGHQGTGIGYHTTRKRCGCKAGSAGSPCKHRAILIAHLDIRQPAIERQWQKLRADRRGAKAVA